MQRYYVPLLRLRATKVRALITPHSLTTTLTSTLTLTLTLTTDPDH